MKKKYFILLGVVLVLLSVLVWQDFFLNRPLQVKKLIRRIKSESNPYFTEALEDYERELTLLQLFSKTPGAAIAVVKDSTIVYMKGFGVRELGKPDSVDENTVFRIASVSKCFASFLTGVLVQENRLAWDDPVIRYVPTFSLSSPEETPKLTVRHVLSHSTGLPFHSYTNLVEDGHTLQEMLDRLKEVPLSAKVGEMYSYQNVAYSLVGEAIRGATGKSYEGWMIEKVFGPLDMKNASIDYAGIMMNPNVATPHLSQRTGWRKTKITDTYYNVSPAGGINASISDMAKWMVALLGNRPDVIRKQTLDTLFTPTIKAPSKNRNYGRRHRLSDSYYGLGWRILHYPDDTLVYHGGYVSGFRSEVAVNQKEKIAICILANAPGELPDNGIPIFFDIYKKYQEQIIAWDNRRRKTVARDSL